MPESKKLQQKLEKEKVTFVYICLDSKPDTWKVTLSKLNLMGIQYYCDKPQSASLKKVFNIDGIPFHMLLNKSGDIVDSGNYLGASNPVTETKITKLLGNVNTDKQIIKSF